MTRPFDHWTVQPHGKLVQRANDIWTVDGVVKMPLTAFPRRMTVVRLSDQRLVIYSAVSLEHDEMSALEAIGWPTYLVVPNAHHRLDARAWKQRYARIVVCAPAGARDQIEDTVHVDTVAPDFNDARVTYATLAGTHDREAALLIEGEDGTTLVLNDIVANMPAQDGVAGLMLRAAGFGGHDAQIPRIVRMTLVDDGHALRSQLESWSALDRLRRVIVSHGDVIEEDPRQTLRTLAVSLG